MAHRTGRRQPLAPVSRKRSGARRPLPAGPRDTALARFEDLKRKTPGEPGVLHRGYALYLSIRTIVGLGMLLLPPYATEPRYFAPVGRPVVEIDTAPVVPVVAVAGALTVMLPASVLPSVQLNKLK